MNRRKITGLVLLVIGIIILIISFYVKSRIAEVQEGVSEINKPFSRNPIGKSLGSSVQKMAEEKIGQYNMMVFWGIAGGVILVVIGAGMTFFVRRK